MGNSRDHLLQRYFDGELGPGERVAFEATMTADDHEQLAALAEMRALLASTLEAESAGVDILAGVERTLALSAKKALRHGSGQAAVRGWRGRVRGRTFLGTSAGVLMATAAAFLFLLGPWHAPHPTNNCDIEQLEVGGGTATVLTLNDATRSDETTVIWTTEEN